MHDYTNTPALAAAAVMTLTDLEARDTAWLDVQNKQDDGPLLFNGQPVRIEIRSPGTREALQAQHKADQARTAATYAAMRGKPVKETIEGKIAQNVEKLVAVTTRIENLPFSPEEIYSNPKLGYITAQVSSFHGDWANF